MDDKNFKTVESKLKRLNVDYHYSNGLLILRGTKVSFGNIFLSIILPIIFFVFVLFTIIILEKVPDIDRITVPKALFILPLTALLYGVKNLLKLKKSKKNEIFISSENLIILDKNNNKIKFMNDEISDISIKIKENSSNVVGELYANIRDKNSHLILNVISDDEKYLMDDLNFLKDSFLSVLKNKN